MGSKDRRYKEKNDIHMDLPVLEQWDFHILDAKSQGKVTKLETDVGTKCLHMKAEAPGTVFHLFLLLEHLAYQGLKRIPRFVRTRFGEPYAEMPGRCYWISDWIHGRPIHMKDQNDLVKSVRQLAEFHQASKGFYLPGEPADSFETHHWGPAFLGVAAKMVDLKSQVKGPSFFKESVQMMAERAVNAGKILVGPRYNQLKQQMKRDLSFCHGAFNREHLIVGKRGEIYLTGLAHWRRDIPLRDLGEFLFLAGKENQWDHDLCRKLVLDYDQIAPLLPGETELLSGYLGFPFGYWELCQELAQEHAGREKTKKRLEAYLGQEEKKEKCLLALF